MSNEPEIDRNKINEERRSMVAQLEDWLEKPMLILGFVWLILLVLELTGSLSPALALLGTIIWIIFILDFALKFILAPEKINYLKSSWLTALSLLVPALRVFRIFRVVRVLQATQATRGLRLFRVLTSLNRGMRALGASMGRRGFGYVVALSIIVAFGGAAGMYAFERENPGGINSYGDALWWTAMTMTTMGSDYFPRSVEGRILCFALALYAFAVFGYVTATLATFFVERDTENAETKLVSSDDVQALQGEIALLREEINLLRSGN
jgi:voltage-gated potassium channel